MADLQALCDDLAAEHAALDALVAPLAPAAWETVTPAVGWAVRDQIAHLANGDESAQLAVTDPTTFRERAQVPREEREGQWLARARAMSSARLLAWWRQSRARMVDAFLPLDPAARIGWYGPSMSARSFATARLMETWAHGQDICDALGLTRPATARLRHICHLGVLARPWSYTVRGLTAPEAPVRVELQSPAGDAWTWGEPIAADTIRGTALDFALLVIRRRHAADTALVAEGPYAQEWLGIAQCFAGPPGHDRLPGMFPRPTG